MKICRLLISTLVATAVARNAFGQNASTNSEKDIETLKQQIQELDQKVRVLEREREMDQDDSTAAAKTRPLVKLDSSGFTFSSADTNFVIGLHGLIQFDSRSFFDVPTPGARPGNFLLRKARPILTGTVFHDFDFNFTPEFGGGTVAIYDAYVNYRYNPALQLEAGKFKSPVGLELLQSDTRTFFNERSLLNNLVPNRDLGLELHGDLFDGVANYAAAVLGGTPDQVSPSNTDPDNNVAFAGRLFFLPFKKLDIEPLQGFGIGVGGSYENDEKSAANLAAGYKTDGQQTFFSYTTGVVADGRHWRISPQGYYFYGPFGLLGEYAISDQRVSSALVSDDLRNTSWEISAGWVLTGENASYNGVTPKHPFDPRKGQWGAWQIVGRYAELDVDDAALADGLVAAGSASRARAWSAGLNWYLNRNLRANLSYSHTQFGDIGGAGGSSHASVTGRPENVIFTRIQLAF